MISITWKVVGFGMMLFVAAIQSIDREIIEAAVIDGAGYWQRLPHRPAAEPPDHPAGHADQRHRLDAGLRSVLHHDVGGPRGQTFTAVYWIYQNSFI